MIKPTIGRIVLVRSVGSLDEQPFAGIITYVHSNEVLNLSVFDATGIPHPRTFVPLVQEGDDRPEQGFFAEWMPYQIEQAKKHEDTDPDVVSVTMPQAFAAELEQAQETNQVVTAAGAEVQPEALPKKTKKAAP